ncbi:glutathione S-transferase T3-like [Salvia hispanica]|uniref:glutathione S-transferase T3-like n=1 Tax=Salvia hispanica TaxID=49212 RepID=UPI002008F738|nr:glutathione S-transferase T3-like [Salvia hispanica]
MSGDENFGGFDLNAFGDWGACTTFLGATGFGRGEEEEEDLGRYPYNRKETLALYNAWVSISYDPIVENQQTRLCFWEKVTEAYNETKPKGARRRNLKMLCSLFDRCDRDIKKFCAIYGTEVANYQNGASGADILRAALRVFKDDKGKDFKHVDVWSTVKDLERWAGDVPSCTGSNSKHTKHTAGGQYSFSEGGEG